MLAWFWKRLADAGEATSVSGRDLDQFPPSAVEAYLNKRVLIEQPDADTWPVCAHCECGLDARPIRKLNDRLLARCPLDSAADEFLEESDLCRFSIDLPELVRAIAAAGGFQRPEPIASDLWRLGLHLSGRSVFLAADPGSLQETGTILAIKAAAAGAPASLLASDIDTPTALRLKEAGIHLLRLEDCLSAPTGAAETLVLAMPVSDAVPRLYIDRSRRFAELDGRRLDLPPQTFALLLRLAEQSQLRDPVLLHQTIEIAMQRPPNEVVRDLRNALVANGISRPAAKALIVTVRGAGYRLGLTAGEVVTTG